MKRLLVICALSFCALTASAQASTLVSYAKAGGLAGIRQSITVSTGGTAKASSGGSSKSKKVAATKFSKLKKLVKAAKVSTLKSSYGPPKGETVADGITQTISVGDKTISVSTGGNPPQRLSDLIDALQQLVDDAKLPIRSPRNPQ